jgi:hypothetical protein
MKTRHVMTAVTFLALLPSVGVTAGTRDRDADLRDRVLKADTPDKAGEAYEAYFRHLGPAGVRGLLADEDTGIALQAAWEVHKKPVKRVPPVPNRTDDLYDRDELARFREFLKDRTKAPLPDWWAAALVDVEFFPGQHLASGGDYTKGGPTLGESKAGPLVPEGAELERAGESLRYTAGGRAVEFPPAALARFGRDCYAGVLGEKGSAVAAFSPAGGFRYKLAGFTGKGGEPAWVADVWAAGRKALGGHGVHRVELVERDGTVFVFGAESHGTYLEAFDAVTGKCRYRFCTGYWFHFSEGWGRE